MLREILPGQKIPAAYYQKRCCIREGLTTGGMLQQVKRILMVPECTMDTWLKRIQQGMCSGQKRMVVSTRNTSLRFYKQKMPDTCLPAPREAMAREITMDISSKLILQEM